MPRIVPTQPSHRREHRILRRVNVPGRHAIELCPAIRASVQASQPDSPSLVRKVCRSEYSTNGRTDFLLFSAACFAIVSNVFACCFLRLEDIDVAAMRWSGPHPSFFRLPNGVPSGFRGCSDPRSHREDAACSRRFAVGYKQGAVAPISPSNGFPAQPEALFRPQTSVNEDGSNGPERLWCSRIGILASSSRVMTRSRCLSPGSILIRGATSSAPHSTDRRRIRRSPHSVLLTVITCSFRRADCSELRIVSLVILSSLAFARAL